MKTRYHIAITKKSLGDRFAEDPLKTIIKANIMQDRISNQFGHDYIHFDGSAFKEGFNYIRRQTNLVIQKVGEENFFEAQQALGRLLHTWQDFYSHSNYVTLWLEKNPDSVPGDIDHDDLEIIEDPELISGKNYGLVEFAAMLPLISNIIVPLMPEDSHARTNMDSPSENPGFQFAFEAALKRTNSVYLQILNQLSNSHVENSLIEGFQGKPLPEVKV